MAITQVHKSNYASSIADSLTQTNTFGFTAALGNLLVACISSDSTFNLTSGWTRASTIVDFAQTDIWYKVSAGNETSLAVTATANACFLIGVTEWSSDGAAWSLDTSPTGVNRTGSTAVASPTTATTKQNEELAIACWGNGGGSSAAYTSSTETNSFVEEFNGNTTAPATATNFMAYASRKTTATGTFSSTITGTNSASHHSTGIAMFRAPPMVWPRPQARPARPVAMRRRQARDVPTTVVPPRLPLPVGPNKLRRLLAYKRGRRVEMVRPQVNPPIPFPAAPEKLLRVLAYKRGRRADVVRPQVNPPLPFPVAPERLRRGFGVRGHRTVVVPNDGGVDEWSQWQQQEARTRGFIARRGKRADVVPTQVVVALTLPLPILSSKRRLAAMVRRGTTTRLVGESGSLPMVSPKPRRAVLLVRRTAARGHIAGQAHPAVPTMVTKSRRGLLVRRGVARQQLPDQTQAPMVAAAKRRGLARLRSSTPILQKPVPAQVIIPRAPDWIMRPHRQRGWLLRRGKRVEFPTPQATLPIPILPLPVLQKRAQRGWLFRRGRRADVVPPQIIITPPFIAAVVTPAMKERYAILRRRGSVPSHIPGQPHPVLPTRAAPRRVVGLLRRRGAPVHIPGQPHPVVPTRAAPRRVVGLLRRKQQPHIPGQAHPPLPTVSTPKRRFVALRRATKPDVPVLVPAQPNRWKPSVVSQARAVRGWLFRRGKHAYVPRQPSFTYIAPERVDVQERTVASFTEPDRVVSGERDRARHREPNRFDTEEQ